MENTLRFEDQLPAKLVTSLRRVQTFIVENPDQFDMINWAYPKKNTACGTVGCIAGHMAMDDTDAETVREVVANHRWWDDFMIGEQPFPGKPENLTRLIGIWVEENIPEGFRNDFDNLFLPGQWPKGFNFLSAEDASRRIDYFLETGR